MKPRMISVVDSGHEKRFETGFTIVTHGIGICLKLTNKNLFLFYTTFDSAG
jgi:hypothetical protein